MTLADKLRAGRKIRVVGFDDAPFRRSAEAGTDVLVCGVVCSGTRFEGMVSTRIEKDGWNATECVIGSLASSKFLPQLHAVLIDGIAFGGFNVVDLPAVAGALALPVISVMRAQPDFDAIERALQNLEDPERRMDMIQRGGRIHAADTCFFQVAGAPPDLVPDLLDRVTDRGHLPEAIRIAHLIGAAIVTGESGSRA
jgi:endonuclease V-like protein UPF0215 family